LPTFKVFLSNNAEKGLRNAELKIKALLKEAIDFLEINPVPVQEFDVTKISGSESNYRIRISGYRILYTVKWNEKEIEVFDIDKRKGRSYS